MKLVDLARKLRPFIEKAVQSLSDDEAVEAVTLYPKWMPGVTYTVGFRFQHEGVLYSVLQEHTSQDTWAPATAPSLYAKVLIPDDEFIYPWEQPDSTNPYMAGNTVTHNGYVWTSDIDNNVWEPGVYGWAKIGEVTTV